MNKYIFQPPRTPRSVKERGELMCNMESGIPFIQLDNDFDESAVEIIVKILYSHGNGEDLYSCMKYLKLFIDYLPKKINEKKVGYVVWAWDYPSYGESKKTFETLLN